MKIEGKEIEEFVYTAVQSIKAGLDKADAKITGKLHFELGVVTTSSAQGGLRILVADASGKLSEKFTTKIVFDAGPKTKAEVRFL